VVNASPLIVLGKVSMLDILPNLCRELIIPEGVALEISRGPSDDNAKRWIENEGQNFIKDIGPINFRIASWDLGLGETEVLSYCFSNPGYAAIVDDLAAKKCAGTFSLKSKGTLAVLVIAKKNKLIPEIKPVLDRIIDYGFRVSPRLYKQILTMVDEA